MSNIKPISPKDIEVNKLDFIPSEVIEVVNNILGMRYNGQYSITITQEEVIFALLAKGFSREEISEKNMLYFEQPFRDNGWIVCYDKPAYNEDYKPQWVFKAR